MYPVTMGATTIWERWDSMLPNGDINPGEMTSFNHYALGGVADWVYKVVGGIRPDCPGYESVLIKPVPGRGIEWARTRLESPHGTIVAQWRLSHGRFRLDLDLPQGLTARVVLPDGQKHVVTRGGTQVFSCEMRDPQSPSNVAVE
uniref:alpha-L-rhamnosidase n=1 Tax=uncultured Arthrobacter sp. TaxID=114050 RepID=A0A060CC71_9MICC|nr:Bac_rhamnosid [uncultured Arthrobacter sp.]